MIYTDRGNGKGDSREKSREIGNELTTDLSFMIGKIFLTGNLWAFSFLFFSFRFELVFSHVVHIAKLIYRRFQ